MRKHELKTWPEPFDAVERREKHHEYRRDDRGFEVGDILVLHRWDPGKGCYTGRVLRVCVTYISRGPMFGVPDGYCVMSIEHAGSEL
jgi:hypothetical protein